MSVHREQNMKREDQQDAAIRCLLLTSVSTCFGHHYARLQENKGPVTVFGVLFECWMHKSPPAGPKQSLGSLGLFSPKDGLNDSRNMLRQKLIINI